MGIVQADHPLFNILKDHIIHCTSIDAYKSICKDGFIKVNDDSFPYTWEQTKASCVYQLGGISLLDFGLPENEVFFVTDQKNFSYAWESMLVAHSPMTVIIKINRDKILDRIMSGKQIRKKIQKCLLIPFVEVCSLEPIPINTFEGIVAVRSISEFVEVSRENCLSAGL